MWGLKQGRAMLFWLIMHTRFARSQPPLSEFGGGHLPDACAANAKRAATTSSHSHTVVATKAEAKQQRKKKQWK